MVLGRTKRDAGNHDIIDATPVVLATLPNPGTSFNGFRISLEVLGKGPFFFFFPCGVYSLTMGDAGTPARREVSVR